jgi:hypothetical protein
MRIPRRELAVYALLSAVLLALPLLTVLHVESAAVVAGVGFFVAGWGAVRRLKDGATLAVAAAEQAGAILLPLAALTAATLWVPNCAYATGLMVYALFPGVTVLFATAAAYAATGLLPSSRWARAVVVGGGLAVAAGGPAYDLGLHPQFYTYNHVFGGVLGPIYDEQLAFRGGLFVFRGLTLLWTGVLLGVGFAARRRQSGARWRDLRPVLLGMGLALAGIVAVYAVPARTGINTTEAHLQRSLGGHLRTAHFDLYYDPASMTRREARTLAADHEAEYARMARRLGGTDVEGRIQSYVYPSPDVKARLTGARTTSVSPVWLGTPQVHLLRRRVEGSFSHELAHVFSRAYGLPVINASWAVGLVEGWAVALEAPSHEPSPHDLVAVSALNDSLGTDGEGGLQAQARGIASRLSPWGFWTGRGAVSYATMGSFVSYLLDTYGPEPLKAVYATAGFESAYGKPLDRLAAEWAAFLRGRAAVSVAAHEVVSRQFTRPSLFETECPHYVPPYRRQWQDASRLAAEGDTSRAVQRLRASVAAEPRFVNAHVDLARLRLARGEVEAARQQLDTLQAPLRPPAVALTQADAAARLGDAAAAGSLYAAAVRGLPASEHPTRARLHLRDAVAARPGVVRVLTSGDSAAVQARRLEALARRAPRDPAVWAWAALRWQDAYAFDRALAAWDEVVSRSKAGGGEKVAAEDEEGGTEPVPASRLVGEGRPPAWQEAVRLQVLAWMAEAALRSGHPTRAHHLAHTAATGYVHYGDAAAREVLHALAERAEGKGER